METVIEQLKAKLQETQHNLQINAAEFQALQSEHDTLLERHNKMLQETVAKEAELREKYALPMKDGLFCVNLKCWLCIWLQILLSKERV